MLLSFALMGGAITVLALTPSYASIGVAAPIIVIAARLTQGFALGGEIGSATAYLLELGPPHRRGFAAALQGASQSVAATLGASAGLVLTALLPHDLAQTYAWRIALLLGALTVPFGLWVRNRIPETLHLEGDAYGPTAAGVRPYRKVILLGLMIVGAGTTATYIFNYMATFAQATLHLSQRVAFSGAVVNNGVQVVAVLTGGFLSDRYGRKPLMVCGMLPLAGLILPMFLWLTTQRDALSFIAANAVLSAAGGLWIGTFYAALIESLPRRIRTRTFALVYAGSVAVVGGSTQLITTWLVHVTHSAMAPAWYLTGATLAGLAAMLFFPESAPVRRVPPVARDQAFAIV
jgi:MFS family permease